MKKIMVMVLLLSALTMNLYAQTTEDIINDLEGNIQSACLWMNAGKNTVYISTATGLSGFLIGTYYKTKESVDGKEYAGAITTSYTIGAISIIGAITGLIMWSKNSKEHEVALNDYYNYLRLVDYKPEDTYFVNGN